LDVSDSTATALIIPVIPAIAIPLAAVLLIKFLRFIIFGLNWISAISRLK